MRNFNQLLKVTPIKWSRGCNTYSFHTMSTVLSFVSDLFLGQTETRQPISSGLRQDVLVEKYPDMISRHGAIEYTSPRDHFDRLLTFTNT